MLAADGKRRFLFVGGKGGVGKTTTAAALAVRQAAMGRKTLIVSTDPAHSLGDALGVSLGGEPRPIDLGDLHCDGGSLHAMEIDPCEVVENFRRALCLDQLRTMLRERRGGLGAGLLSALASAGVDLEALAILLELSPPGIDEAVALGQLMQLLGDTERGGHFERVVIDTAPTGHTLRLLAFPRFLHGLIGTVLAINEKVSLFSPASRFLGKLVGGEELQQQLQVSKAYLERQMASMSSVSEIFKDASTTSFVVVSLPTHLAVTESKRLLHALEEAEMPVRHVVMNQCPFLLEDGSADDFAEAGVEQLLASAAVAGEGAGAASEAVLAGQQARALRKLLAKLAQQRREALKRVEAFEREVGPQVRVVRSPVFTEELTGPASLDRYARLVCGA